MAVDELDDNLTYFKGHINNLLAIERDIGMLLNAMNPLKEAIDAYKMHIQQLKDEKHDFLRMQNVHKDDLNYSEYMEDIKMRQEEIAEDRRKLELHTQEYENIKRDAQLNYAKYLGEIEAMKKYADNTNCGKHSSSTSDIAKMKKEWEYIIKFYKNKGYHKHAEELKNRLDARLGKNTSKRSVDASEAVDASEVDDGGEEEFGGGGPIRRRHLHGGIDVVLPPGSMTSEEVLKDLRFQGEIYGKEGDDPDDTPDVNELIKKLAGVSTADKPSDIGNSRWLYDEKGTVIPDNIDKWRNFSEPWENPEDNRNKLLKCIKYQDRTKLCECIESINIDEENTNIIVQELTPFELKVLFKLFNVGTYRVDHVIVPIKASVWKNNFKCPTTNESIVNFITKCIELCSNPKNYALLNTAEDIKCYTTLQDEKKKQKCLTTRRKPAQNEVISPLCSQQIFAPIEAMFQLGGSVNYVKQNSTIGKFLMSGGRITKQSGGSFENACCANKLEKSLNVVVAQLKNQGKKINDTDLSVLTKALYKMGEIEAGIRNLIEKKLKIYSYSLASRNCRLGDKAEELNIADIVGDNSAMNEKLKEDYELCSKEIQDNYGQLNHLIAQITNGLNTLQYAQPLLISP